LNSLESVTVPFLTIGTIFIVTYLVVTVGGKISDFKKDRIERRQLQ